MTRIAIAGSGEEARRLAAALGAVRGAHLHQVVSSTAELAASIAAPLGVAGGTHDQLRSDTEALIVAEALDTRFAVATAALGRGIPVLVESPIATSSADAEALVSAAEGSATMIGCAEPVLLAPTVLRALDHRVEMGALTHLSIRVVHQEPTALTPHDVLWTLGHHAVALALSLAAPDDPAEVQATGGPGTAADLATTVELTLASGLVAHLELGRVTRDPVRDVQAASLTGVVRIELVPEPLLEIDGDEVMSRPEPTNASPPSTPDHAGVSTRARATLDALEAVGYVPMLQGFADAVAGRGGRVCPLGFGRRVVDVVAAADRSIESGRREPLGLRD